MACLKFLTILILTSAAGAASAACTLRFGYTDQELPPYYLGNGTAEARPPGAVIDFVREMSSSTACTMVAVRLPLARLRLSLEAGAIDAAAIYLKGKDATTFAVPRNANGELAVDKAMRVYTVVYVRASDGLAADTDPASYFAGRKVGITHGAVFGSQLQQAGIGVDDGAVDAARNLDKLKRGRIDGFAVAVTSLSDMDGYVGGHDITVRRLAKPLAVQNIWLVFSKPFQAHNGEAVEAMWRWIANNGRTRFGALVKHYERKP